MTGSITLTTADLLASAVARLKFLRSKADGHHAKAMAEAGHHTKPWHSYIDLALRESDYAVALECLCTEHGDLPAAAAIRADHQATFERLIRQSSEAHMSSFVGWDPATKNWRSAAA